MGEDVDDMYLSGDHPITLPGSLASQYSMAILFNYDA